MSQIIETSLVHSRISYIITVNTYICYIRLFIDIYVRLELIICNLCSM